MKRRIFTILCLVGLLFVCVNVAKADVALTTSVTMPAGAINVHITKINVDPLTPTLWLDPTPVTQAQGLNFGQLKELFDPDTGLSLGVFGPRGNTASRGMYFALDIAVTAGTYPPSIPSITVSFPVSNTLAKKLIATPAHVTWEGPLTTDTSEVPHPTYGAYTIDRTMTFNSADFTGHWTRVYVGVYIPPKIGDPTPGGNPVPFTTTSASSYSGSLTITGAGGVV